MRIIRLVVGQLQTNCYLAIDEETGKSLIIDPGDAANFIAEKIIQLKLKPAAIIATHGHFDHVLAANELQLAFKTPFLIHKEDQKILNHMSQSASWWLKRKIIEQPPKVTKFIKEGGRIRFGRCFLKIIETPGHSPGSICLYNQKNKILFSGDTIFSGGIGRTDLSYGSRQAIQKSLKKINQKFTGFTIYPGHGEKFYL